MGSCKSEDVRDYRIFLRELLGMHVEELTHPEDRERDNVEFENLISGKSLIFHVGSATYEKTASRYG